MRACRHIYSPYFILTDRYPIEHVIFTYLKRDYWATFRKLQAFKKRQQSAIVFFYSVKILQLRRSDNEPWILHQPAATNMCMNHTLKEE
jgi:hypothetical protein